MQILLYDKMQDATGAPAAIISPALSDRYTAATSFSVTFDSSEVVNCIGIGYTDATEVTITDGSDPQTVTLLYSETDELKYNNGLYIINQLDSASYTISHNGTFIGRVGIGEWRTLGTNPTKEIGFYTTNESRLTMAGQVIPGAGGYSGRRFEADVRYKFTETIYEDLRKAYNGQISKNYPFFIYTEDEQHKLPDTMLRFYARTKDASLLLQSSSYKFLYSYKFSFYEAF
ncbi:MAG: hypothetical protein WC900_01890 [Oscillospiraceae bacterium]|jgi:hypothetical protein